MANVQTTPEGLPVASPATAWAQLGYLSMYDLVAVGDFFCRVWREGYGRPSAGTPPLTTPERLRAALDAGRRIGRPKLERALGLIRFDSWSPRESLTRCLLVDAGLPEPTLNQDMFDDDGTFLGCLDLAYPDLKIGVEYQGAWHAATFPHDVERVERFRAAGWIIIQVTAELLRRPEELVARVRVGVHKRG